MRGHGVVRRQKKPKVNKGMIKRSSLGILSKPVHSSIQKHASYLRFAFFSSSTVQSRSIVITTSSSAGGGYPSWVSGGGRSTRPMAAVSNAGTNDMRRLLGNGYGRAARNMCLYCLREPALIPTIMRPWAIQTFSPGLAQSRSPEALLGMLPGRQHSSEIICSRRSVARRARPKVSQSQIVMAVARELTEQLAD